MINVANQTDDQLNHWVKKTSISLNNLSYSQLNHDTAAFQNRRDDLADRWTDLQEEMDRRGIWIAHCEARGLVPDHDAGDCMA